MFQYDFGKRENGRIAGLYGVCSGVCLDSKNEETLRFQCGVRVGVWKEQG